MTAARFDVIGIGNAIVDIIGRCDEAYLATIGATKGSMRLVGADEVKKIYATMGPAVEISGGSAANTIAGIASFGGKAAFIGTVASDEFGKIFTHDIRSIGVAFDVEPISNEAPTSRSLILVTPDGERTMNTFLGISTSLSESQLKLDLIRDSAILYLEGYLFDEPQAKQAFRKALQAAKTAGRKVALTLSDGFCVDRHRAEFLELIRSGIDILFANESEIKSLYQTESFDLAAKNASNDTKLAVLTRSAKGSVLFGEGRAIEIAPEPISELIDTTGAGDLYASGFLFGYSQGYRLEICGRLASFAASEIISHIGARPEIALNELARQRGMI
ncbi:PfkB domain-containing protein [Hyphomicrobium denitrificans 1NES1]|uniref:PfkB domain-containing protein n=1 Tax=Hyphomicrobium denitrificans 1NES1 TaxID=670307 RepID=N0B9C4_9HYPH|nr:adenosine kinase [Hyphomicrobium denitrificans]AGK59628.1 PfkB domain-containing protein [Hyphomicrobium denitrificans 1NES1]